jgi:hypothetical protein
VRHLGETLSGFFRETGWGTLTVTPIAQAVIALDSSDWSEADAVSRNAVPFLSSLQRYAGRRPGPGLQFHARRHGSRVSLQG